MDNIVLISLKLEEIRVLIREVLHSELNSKPAKELLNFKEACSYMGGSASALNQWKSQNRIPFKKLGKRVFFSREELLSAMENSNFYKLKEIE
jgi:excisionase family DNA binding protein